MRSSESERIVSVLRKVVRHRKRIILACLASTILLAFIYNQVATPEYEASTSMVFDEKVIPVSPTPYQRSYSEEMQMANRLAEISSFATAEGVAAALPSEARDKIAAWGTPGPGADVQRAITSRIKESIAAQPLPNSNIVRVSVRMRDPQICMLVANTVPDVIAERSRKDKQEGAGGARDFIESQLQQYQMQLSDNETALMSFKQAHSLTSFDDEAKEILHRSTEAEVLYNNAVANHRAAVDRLAAIEKELDAQRRDLVPQVTDVATPSAQRLKQALVNLQVEYQNLKVQGYPSNHPRMVQLEHDINQTTLDLAGEAKKLAEGKIALDPISRIDKYVNDAIDLRMEIESLKAQETALKQVLNQYNARLAALPSKEFDLVRMTRERDVNQRIYSMLQEKLQEARITQAEQLPGVRTIDRALLPLDPAKPRKKVNLALGGLLGLLLGLGLAFGLEGFDPSVDSVQSFQRLAKWRVLASIPRIEKLPRTNGSLPATSDGRREARRTMRALIAHHDRRSGTAEAYRILRTKLQFAGFGDSMRVLLVTSMVPGEGKTTCVANLAVAMADLGRPTLVIDGEIRKPGMHTIFDLRQEPGLAEVLAGLGDDGAAETAHKPSHVPEAGRDLELAWQEEPGNSPNGRAAAYDPILQTTFVPHLTVVASGAAGFEAAQAMAIEMRRLRSFLAVLRTRFNHVIIDAPPLMLVHDVALLSSIADGVLLVVNSRNLDKEMLAECRQTLEAAKANVVGVLMNHVEPAGVYRKNSYYTS